MTQNAAYVPVVKRVRVFRGARSAAVLVVGRAPLGVLADWCYWLVI